MYRPLEQPPVREDKESVVWNKWFQILTDLQTKIKVYEESVNPGTVAANTTAEVDVTLDNVRSTDIVLSVNKPTHSTGLGVVGMRVKAEDTVSITFMNTTGSGIGPGAENYKIVVLEQ